MTPLSDFARFTAPQCLCVAVIRFRDGQGIANVPVDPNAGHRAARRKLDQPRPR
ncbi:MAG: hypothetical protein AAGF32_09175 [Pseudomonadota bacterium]